MLIIGKNHRKAWAFRTFNILQRKKIDDYKRIYNVNALHLRIDYANGYIEEKNGNKCLIFDSVDVNNKLLKNTIISGIELEIRSKK